MKKILMLLICTAGVASADPVIPTIQIPDAQKAFSKHLNHKLGKLFSLPKSIPDRPVIVPRQ